MLYKNMLIYYTYLPRNKSSGKQAKIPDHKDWQNTKDYIMSRFGELEC